MMKTYFKKTTKQDPFYFSVRTGAWQTLMIIAGISIFHFGHARTNGFTTSFNWPQGTVYDDYECGVDMGSCMYWHEKDNNSTIDNNQLRIRFPQGIYGTDCGVQGRARVNRNQKYSMEYKIKFESGFDWRLGGKLPGLAGGTGPSGCTPPDGRGFSARLMWTGGGRLIAYIYNVDKVAHCGDAWESGINFRDNRWYTIKMEVEVNTGSNYDGKYKLWVDGNQVISRSNVRWMTSDHSVNQVFWDIFMGGAKSNWAPDHTQYLWIDDVVVTKGGTSGGSSGGTSGGSSGGTSGGSGSYPNIESYSSQESTQPATNLLDGSTAGTSRWSASGFPQNVVIDYGETKSITDTKLYTYQDRAYQFKIEASNSSTSGFSTIVNRLSNTSSSQPITNTFSAVDARYLKITVESAHGYTGSWVSLTEFEITEGPSAQPMKPKALPARVLPARFSARGQAISLIDPTGRAVTVSSQARPLCRGVYFIPTQPISVVIAR